MTVVAEGIEVPEVAELLTDLGCTVGQGFGLARPAPAGDITRRMESDRPAQLR
jgi:EAL domain-containing protein (putative c-di-GMP-specific phosphodiesterase class I)